MKKINIDSSKIKEKIPLIKEKLVSFVVEIKNANYKDLYKKIKRKIKAFSLKKFKIPQKYRKATKWISDSWKFLLSVITSFLAFYYIIGSFVVNNIDTKTVYKIPKENPAKFETTNAMAFLINREIDDKMWTPNLPLLFPAYVLDNMPNFQTGIIQGIKVISSSIANFTINNEEQNKSSAKAYEYLSYPPNIWLLSKKSAFRIAPSSNNQYRKARHELLKYSETNAFLPYEKDLAALIKNVSIDLRKKIDKEDKHIAENSAKWIDNSADAIFYKNKGYAFALWQLFETLGNDFKEVILEKEIYPEWTYVVSALRKAAEYNPLIIRNAKLSSISSPNHLIVQAYYLERAVSSLEKIQNLLLEENNADKIGEN